MLKTILRKNAPQQKKEEKCKGLCTFEEWQIDFTQISKTRENFKILLVFVNTFSRWEAYPTRTEKVTEVVKLLLKEIIPRFGFPHNIHSNNGPSPFTSETSQKVGQALQIQRKSHA